MTLADFLRALPGAVVAVVVGWLFAVWMVTL